MSFPPMAGGRTAPPAEQDSGACGCAQTFQEAPFKTYNLCTCTFASPTHWEHTAHARRRLKNPENVNLLHARAQFWHTPFAFQAPRARFKLGRRPTHDKPYGVARDKLLGSWDLR
jgi:hypothetical protein